MTLRPPFAVRLAPLPMVKIPLLEVISPVTLPAPFQLPPVTPSVPPIEPPLPKLIMPPLSVAFPVTDPTPLKVPLPMEMLPERIPLSAKAAPLANVASPLTVPELRVLLVPLIVSPPVLKVPRLLMVLPPPFIVTIPVTDPVPLREVEPLASESVPDKMPFTMRADAAF